MRRDRQPGMHAVVDAVGTVPRCEPLRSTYVHIGYHACCHWRRALTSAPRTVLDSGTNIYSLLSPKRIAVRLAGDTKQEIIDRLVDVLAAEVDDVEAVRAAVLARERQMSTGVGSGIALPHAKTDSVSDTLVAFGVTEQPIDFGAIDDEPVRLVFLLVGPTAVASQHIRLLSRVSRILNQRQIRDRLIAAASAREVMMVFEEAEAALLVP